MINFLKNTFFCKTKNSPVDQIQNFNDIIKSLTNGRKRFHKDNEFIKFRLAEVFELYFNATDLIKKVASKDDEEKLILEIINISFRRMLSSFFLLESGFAQEARMLLRNFLEYILIIIDITYNPASLVKWEKTEHDNLDNGNGEWYFSASKIIDRIKVDVSGVYPHEEKKNAINAHSEWKKISNQILHAHSRSQTKNIIKQNNIELFGWCSLDDNKKHFNVYRELLLALIQEIIFIPKYKEKISQSKEFIPLAEIVADRFNKYQKVIACEREVRLKECLTITELGGLLKKYEIPINIGALPNNALISSIEIDIVNGEYVFSVTYAQDLNSI